MAILLGMPLVTSCGPHRCAADDGEPLVLRWSSQKIHPILDAAGHFAMSKFPDPVVTVKATIQGVWLTNQSPSIFSESSVACLELRPGEVIPGDSTRKIVELRFDQYALWVPLKTGQRVTLTFSEKGEFVFVATHAD